MQYLPATHTRTIVSVLPSRMATALWPVPSYTAWWQRHISIRNLARVFTPWCPRLESATSWSQVRNSTATPRRHHVCRCLCGLVPWKHRGRRYTGVR